MSGLNRNTILIVIVLYKKTIENCKTYNCLNKSLGVFRNNYKILFYNNSPEITLTFSNDYEVVNGDKNNMLCGGYNFALNYALENNIEWMLLMDDDTKVTAQYFIKVNDFINFNSSNKEIVAAVPVLKSENKILSPKISRSICWWHIRDISTFGEQKGRLSAFNSLTLIRTNFIKSLGGFSTLYPLDMLDHWYYHRIYVAKKVVYVIDTVIEHNLSIRNYEMNMSIERHSSYIDSEKKFALEELGLLTLTLYKFILFRRFIRQLIFFRNKRFSMITLKKIFI